MAEPIGFFRAADQIVFWLDRASAGVLEQLLTQLLDMVEPEAQSEADPLAELVGIDDDAARPVDPALARLLPDAYPDDDEAAAEYRRYTDRGLRNLRTESGRTLLGLIERSASSPAPVDGAEADASLRAINDLRLVLGVRLGIESGDRDPAAGAPAAESTEDEPDEQDEFLAAAYDWLTWLQSSLLASMHPGW